MDRGRVQWHRSHSVMGKPKMQFQVGKGVEHQRHCNTWDTVQGIGESLYIHSVTSIFWQRWKPYSRWALAMGAVHHQQCKYILVSEYERCHWLQVYTKKAQPCLCSPSIHAWLQGCMALLWWWEESRTIREMCSCEQIAILCTRIELKGSIQSLHI